MLNNELPMYGFPFLWEVVRYRAVCRLLKQLLLFVKERIYARFNINGVSRESRFDTVESWEKDLTESFGVTKEARFARKCVGREYTT